MAGSGTTLVRVDPHNVVVTEGNHRRPSYLMGVPTFGLVSSKFWMATMRLASPMNSISQLMLVERKEVGEARNEIADYYMKLNPRPSYLFFLGDDGLPPWDALIRLWDEMEIGHWDILSGLYYLKCEPPTPCAWRTGVNGPLVPNRDFTPGEVVSVDICGLDFCLIRPEVFDTIGPPPWFQTTVSFKQTDMNGNGELFKSTEDGFFMKKVREAKMRIGIHTGIRVGHLHIGTGMVY